MITSPEANILSREKACTDKGIASNQIQGPLVSIVDADLGFRHLLSSKTLASNKLHEGDFKDVVHLGPKRSSQDRVVLPAESWAIAHTMKESPGP